MPYSDTSKHPTAIYQLLGTIIVLWTLWIVLKNQPASKKFNFTLPEVINPLETKGSVPQTIKTGNRQDSKSLIVTFTDISYFYTTKKWLLRMVSLGYKNLRVYAIDEFALEALKNLKIKDFTPFWHNTSQKLTLRRRNQEYLKNETNPSIIYRINPQDRQKIWKIRLEVIRKLLLQNFTVTVSDVDSIWTKHENLTKISENYD